MKKLLYEQPKAEVFEVRLKTRILGGSPDGYNSTNHTQYLTGGDNNDDYEEL